MPNLEAKGVEPCISTLQLMAEVCGVNVSCVDPWYVDFVFGDLSHVDSLGVKFVREEDMREEGQRRIKVALYATPGDKSPLEMVVEADTFVLGMEGNGWQALADKHVVLKGITDIFTNRTQMTFLNRHTGWGVMVDPQEKGSLRLIEPGDEGCEG